MSPSHALTLVLATRSPHKLEEIRRVLEEDPGLRILSLDEAGIPPSPEEDKIEAFDTFEENAKAKAAHFNSLCGAATIADDSGLEVDVLDGAPGVRSKRFAPMPHLTGEERASRQAPREPPTPPSNGTLRLRRGAAFRHGRAHGVPRRSPRDHRSGAEGRGRFRIRSVL